MKLRLIQFLLTTGLAMLVMQPVTAQTDNASKSSQVGKPGANAGNAAQTRPSGSRTAPAMVTEQIDNTRLVALHGSVRADLSPESDMGPVEDGLQLRLYLVLQRTPEQQAALESLVARQQQPTAAEYHQWLTPQQFGERFGISEQDIVKISGWLESRGMRVNGVTNNASFIDFSASARDVRDTFGTELHYFNVEGGRYPALVQEPMIPVALANVVAGIQGLNRIPAHADHTESGQAAWDAGTHRWHAVAGAGSEEATPAYADGAGVYNVTPQDFYTIYNVNPILNGGTKGATATVAVIEESDIVYGTVNGTTGAATGGDVATFRTLFGVPGTLNMHVYHGYGTVTCNDPGIDPRGINEQGEAALDAEWASALAPSANLIFMSCDQNPNQGIISSEMALIDNNLSDVMSLSYGRTEQSFTSADYSTQDTLLAQAAAQGQSFIVSAGDSGSDAADQNTKGTATAGINVSGFASNPLATVAGGTDFVDTVDQLEGGVNQSTYWGAANSANYADALGYVPETAWNSSCANSILAVYEGFTGAGYCAQAGALGVSGHVVGGTGGFSTHYAVPAYQSGITGYAGTMRAQPDISSFAASGFFGHILVYCDSHLASEACTNSTTFGVSGGTSFVAPQFAGVFGLLVNYTGTRQGLLNPALYALAKAQFTGTATKSSCYSNGTTTNAGVTTASRPASTCTFNDVTSGNNDEPCQAGSTSCFANAGATFGMLSRTGSTSLTVAFPSTPGYDEVTGIGTLNVSNLLTNWYKAFSSTTTVGASATSITVAQSTKLTATVKGGVPTGSTGAAPALAGTIKFAAGGTSLGSCTVSGGTCSLSILGSVLQAGANSVTATFSGSKTYPASTSSAVTVTVTNSGTPAVLLSPTSLAFGSQTDGVQSAAQTVTLTNTGTGTLNIASIQFEGGAGSLEFSIPANGCGTTLAAGSNCKFSVAFNPQSAGQYFATVGVTDNAAGSPQGVSVSGTGVTSAESVSLSATSLAFGTETVGVQTAAQTVKLTNTGTSAVGITSIALAGTGATSYVITAKTCGTTLAVAASCTFSAAFKPTATGALPASIMVTDNASGSPQNVSLSGTGTTNSLTMSPGSLSLGSENVGATSEGQLITVKNTGAAALTLTSITLTGANPTSFSTLDTCYSALPAGASCYVLVSLVPQTTGALSASYNLASNVGTVSVTLTGTGLATAALSFSPSPVAFPITAHGTQSVAKILTVTNTGTSPATFSFIGIGGTYAADFYQLNTCSTTLAAGAHCTVFVMFRPAAAGAYTATMEFFDTAQGGYQGVTLSGTGN